MSHTALKIALLRRTRTQIESGERTYLCPTLHREMKTLKSPFSRTATRELLQTIDSRLNGCFTLEAWLFKTEGIRISDSDVHRTRMRATRLAWIDSLIKELQGE